MNKIFIITAITLVLVSCSTTNQSSYFGYNNNPKIEVEKSITPETTVVDGPAYQAGNNAQDNGITTLNYYYVYRQPILDHGIIHFTIIILGLVVHIIMIIGITLVITIIVTIIILINIIHIGIIIHITMTIIILLGIPTIAPMLLPKEKIIGILAFLVANMVAQQEMLLVRHLEEVMLKQKQKVQLKVN